ncbi:ATP-binding protein [Pseudomonas kuykendallii]|uniref:ATP-binding protein n=1 Tax=Pseudomonas kuykendallii TaxID=1007099 RepID=UPI0028D604C1|nr:ATP-binding protein [Pseudomonas kuykendallii]
MSHVTSIGLRRWIWRAFLQTALIPLILVETVLIAIYLLTNTSIRDAQVSHLREVALEDLQTAAAQETNVVQSELGNIAQLTATYAALTEQALSDTTQVAPAKLKLSASGARYSDVDKGGAASFYSAATPVAQQDLFKVARLERLDAFMRETERHSPLVTSIYFNSWDSYNRIYPWFNTLSQYPSKMNIPDFNFYYLATPVHNPSRAVTWTDVYLDPAGQGWMLSAIAPVFRKDFLEGVVGLDITVGRLLDHINGLDVPWNGYALIVSDDMDIMALPPAGESDFGLDELTSHSYSEAISTELLKPKDFNLFNRGETRALAEAMAASTTGVISLPLKGLHHLIAWNTIGATQWRLLTVVDEAQVFSKTDSLASYYRSIGYLMIAGLVIFYLIFFLVMWHRVRLLSNKLKSPITGIAAMLQDIGVGNWRPLRPDTQIVELEQIIVDVQVMGTRLESSLALLKQANQEAQEASRAKSQFISSMSHELRTPLNAIQGFAQLLQMESPLAQQEGEQDYLEEILLASRHLNQLVADILDWSSIQSERPRLDLQKVDAIALMQACAEWIAPEIQTHRLTLELCLPPGPLWVRAEPRRLRQVLLNLLSNAIKYTPHGSVSLRCARESDWVRLAVVDTGIGIADALQPMLFEPFQRLGQENTAIPGTGIGLSLCKEYASLMHGRMGFHSELHEGSQFWIELPAWAPATQEYPRAPISRATRVYHADRNAERRQLVLNALPTVDLKQFENGLYLLDALERQPADILLLSAELEGLCGRDLMREIHRRPQLAGMPVILFCPPGQAEALASLGASALLSMPVDPLELHRLVQELVREELTDVI